MKRWFFAMLILLAGLALSWSGAAAAAADEITQEDRVAIRSVVQSQLEALADDDAEAAFAQATADTRSRLGNSDTFLQIIKQQFAPIYRHQRAIFSAPEVIGGHMVQVVRLTDSDSSVWLAIYQMQRESDGKWKIAGCGLIETTTVSV
ncbi:MAG: hypothetical protein A3I66_00950 [Burkholderiales bacterium RIFCSPLOWO2_02_FULL_57_36]|nr:MAG: hypothetical protein A3I66_00950 [Burkholderiales bacterium RIFCSPLOWO2_02_FULL_57_36]